MYTLITSLNFSQGVCKNIKEEDQEVSKSNRLLIKLVLLLFFPPIRENERVVLPDCSRSFDFRAN